MPVKILPSPLRYTIRSVNILILASDAGATLSDNAVRESMRGCIQDLMIENENIILTEAADKVGVFAGCPGEPPT